MKKTPQRAEPPAEPKKPRGRHAVVDAPTPSREEARRRIRSKPGYFESLSPDARSTIATADGPAAIGPARND